MVQFDGETRREILAECNSLLAVFIEDETLREAALQEDLRGGRGGVSGSEGPEEALIAIGRWAVGMAMDVARATLAGAVGGARGAISSAAVEWLADEFPRNPDTPEPTMLEAEILARLRDNGAPEAEASQRSARILCAGEKIAARAVRGWGGELFPREGLAALRDALCELYPDLDHARLVATDAGVDVTRLRSQNSARVFWHEIVEEAVRSGCVGLLRARAADDYGGHVELERAAVALGIGRRGTTDHRGR